MALNEPAESYKNVKLYTDYNLDTYEGLSGKDSRSNSGFRARCLKKRTSNGNNEPVLLESVLKKHDKGMANEKGNNNSPYLQYKPCVSFDTVPVSSPSKDSLIQREYPSYDFPGVQIPPELYTMDEWYDNESGYATNDNDGYFIHNEYVTSPSTKSEPITHRSRSPTRITTLKQMQSMFKRTAAGKIVREDYPSRPTVNTDTMVINRAYDQWGSLWNKRRLQIDERLMDRTKYFKHAEILFPDLRKDSTNDKSKSKAEEDDFENMTRKKKRRWLIMHEVIGYPTGPKTLLCHISGRKHTWVGLDYTIMKLAQDTDHVVIVANLAKLKKMTPAVHRHHHHHAHHKRHPSYAKSMNSMYSRSKSISRKEEYSIEAETESLGLTKVRSLDPDAIGNDEGQQDDDDDEEYSDYEGDEDPQWASGYDRLSIEDKLNDILLYISVLLSKEPKSIKVTVEIVIGKSAKVLNDMVNVYMPDLFVMSKKKLTSEIRWHSVHLTDKFLKHSPVPVCVVFVKPMFQFEVNLQKKFNNDLNAIKPPLPKKPKHLVEQIDEWIGKSIQTGSKMERPQQPKVMKSMIEIALASDKKPKKPSPLHHNHSSGPTTTTHSLHSSSGGNSSGSTSRGRSYHEAPLRPLRSTTISPLRNELHRPELKHHGVSVPSTIGVPLTKTRTISTQRPVKNWNADKNSLRRIKSNSPDDTAHHGSANGSAANNGSGGGLFSSLFKKRW
ncbi:hypothetical protein C6P44_005033 [Monosporozyma unispora]|nr:hypothetical protein C6P44_005033 [Kazachstania unispora]